MKKKEINNILKLLYGGNHVIEGIEKSSQCFNNEVYFINLKNPSKKIVIKFIKSKINENNIKKEYNLLKLFQEKNIDLNFPEIIYYDFSKKLISESFIVMDRIEGKTLNEIYDDLPNKKEIYFQLGKIIGAINSITYDYYGYLNEDLTLKENYKYLDWKDEQIKKINKYLDAIKNEEYITSEFNEKNKKILNLSKKILDDELSPCLCHGDLSFSNVIINDNKINALIDYEFTYSGAPIYDLFKSIKNFKKLYNYRENLIEGYCKFKKVPKNWENLMWIYHWMERLNWLYDLDNMYWDELNIEETKKRKELILVGTLNKINEIYDILFKIK
jgi:Ser/Thr protein kinase RdoA (MazF antagonist)